MPAESLADAPRYPLHAGAPREPHRPGDRGRRRACDRRPARAAAAPAGGAQHLRQDLGLRAVRPGRRLGHGGAARRRRGRGAPDAVGARDRGRAGRRRRARRARSAPRRAPRRSRRPRSTSPAAAPSPPRSRTASTSATPSARAPRTRCARRSRAWPRPARCSARRSSRATSRSTTRAAARRSTRRPSSAASACWNASSAVPAAPADGVGTLFVLGTLDAGLRRLRVAGAGGGAGAGRIPEVDLPRAALALRPALRARARRALGARPTTSPTAASRSRWPRSRSRAGTGSR